MNNTEFETKVTDFNLEEIITKLRELGAKENPEMLLRRYVFDMESEDIEWIRLRAMGAKTFLAYKKKIRGNVALGKTEEIEANSEERVRQALSELGLEGKDVGDRDVTEIYADYGHDIHTFKILKFD